MHCDFSSIQSLCQNEDSFKNTTLHIKTAKSVRKACLNKKTYLQVADCRFSVCCIQTVYELTHTFIYTYQKVARTSCARQPLPIAGGETNPEQVLLCICDQLADRTPKVHPHNKEVTKEAPRGFLKGATLRAWNHARGIPWDLKSVDFVAHFGIDNTFSICKNSWLDDPDGYPVSSVLPNTNAFTTTLGATASY